MEVRKRTPLLLFSILFFFIISQATDTITKTQILADGGTLVSSGESFKMGFFGLGNSKNRYLGIWYNKISACTVVWVANRETPLYGNSGVLKLVDPGIIVLLNSTNQTVWSSNSSSPPGKNPVVKLLDSGNLVVKEADTDDSDSNFLWQSFDYPSDTLLPGMKLGKDFVTGLDRYLSSWKSDDDPAPGDYTYKLDPQGYPQAILYRGPAEVFRSGPWNGVRFSGRANQKPNPFYKFGLVFNDKEVYYYYNLVNPSVISRLVLDQSGTLQRSTWIPETKSWDIYLKTPLDDCDSYKKCGDYGSCKVTSSPVCSCLNKFEANNSAKWGSGDWSSGCVRRTNLSADCSKDGFIKYSNYKLPDTINSWFNTTMTLKECKVLCLRKCSCTAYSNLNISGGGSGCLLWFGDLVDMRQFSGQDGQDIYIRMASSELARNGFRGKMIVVAVTLALLLLVLLGLCLNLRLRKKREKKLQLRGESMQGRILTHRFEQDCNDSSQNEDLELPLFDLSIIAEATNDFSLENKLGEGGFGPVYKGKLKYGQEIAVKRLLKNSSQGLDQFKNEVIYIAKLQHRNLVKLLGCCIEGEEKMLIYEYMPNKSLDYFIFDQKRSTMLDWPKRFHIVTGIARGLLYLHQDSRLTIIHRDIKASNILLDTHMNAKISDFGMARSFGGNETKANTQRVVGTYGYMSPEYIVDGIFSMKSDVFSFGVLVLEIVSGKRNRGFYHQEHSHNLLGHAWRLYNEDRLVELIDEHLKGFCHLGEVLRSIHVGLLCVQQSPEDRPTMASVLLMLGNEGALTNYKPKQPGFFTEREIPESYSSSSKDATTTFCEITMTSLNAR